MPHAPAPRRRRGTCRARSGPECDPGEEIGEGLIGGTTSTGRTAVLVGYGVKQTEAKRRPRAGGVPAKVEAPDLSAKGTDVAVEPLELDDEGLTLTAERTRALAKPPVRKLAKDLGIDLGSVTADRGGRHRHPRRRRGGSLGSGRHGIRRIGTGRVALGADG